MLEKIIHSRGLSFIRLTESDVRKGLGITDEFVIPQGEYKLGQAIDDGGCFFDALSQALNAIRSHEVYSEKSLREKCHQYWSAYKVQTEELLALDSNGVDHIEEYGFIQYTNLELKEHFNHRPPIWGRYFIEGVILCRQLKLEVLYIIDLINNPNGDTPIKAYQKVTKQGSSPIDEEGASKINFSSNPCLVVSQEELHFVPILPKREVAPQIDREAAPHKHRSTSESQRQEIIFMQRKYKGPLQLGWNCFDIAIDISRNDLVQYALKHSDSAEFRDMLAPEIRHAAAMTVTYMNLEAAETEEDIAKTLRIAELMQIKKGLDAEDSYNKLIIDADIKQLSAKIKEDVAFPQGSLPESMRTEDLRALVNNYDDAHEAMRAAVAACNVALGYPEGTRLSLGSLDDFFAEQANCLRHADAYAAFKAAREAHFTPHERAFHDHCRHETTYRQYVTDYYGQLNWVAFQRGVGGETTTSMVNIAARMISSCIIIYQREKDGAYKEIYRTANYDVTMKHIEFMGNSHFVELDPAAPDLDSVDVPEMSAGGEAKAASTAPVPPSPPGKELLLSRGFAGSIYQVKILMLLAFEAFRNKQCFP